MDIYLFISLNHTTILLLISLIPLVMLDFLSFSFVFKRNLNKRAKYKTLPHMHHYHFTSQLRVDLSHKVAIEEGLKRV